MLAWNYPLSSGMFASLIGSSNFQSSSKYRCEQISLEDRRIFRCKKSLSVYTPDVQQNLREENKERLVSLNRLDVEVPVQIIIKKWEDMPVSLRIYWEFYKFSRKYLHDRFNAQKNYPQQNLN